MPPIAPNQKNTQASVRSEEHTSELQSRLHLVCRLLLEKKKKNRRTSYIAVPRNKNPTPLRKDTISCHFQRRSYHYRTTVRTQFETTCQSVSLCPRRNLP